MPSYRRTIKDPIWAVYEGDKLIATVRAPSLRQAAFKLDKYKGNGRRLKQIGFDWS